MLDLTRVQRDLESPAYGALCHATSILSRTIQAELAVSLCSDTPHRIEVVHVDCRHDTTDSQRFNQLGRWPLDTCSALWQTLRCDRSGRARRLDPATLSDASACREIAQILEMPEAIHEPRALSLPLGDSPVCRLIFIREKGQPPFREQDPQRVMRFAPQATHLIEQGHQRELQRLGIRPDTLKFTPDPATTHELMDQLSGTEHRVLQQLRLNLTERQVAQALGRSPNTIHVHVKSIYRKLRVNNRSQLLALFTDDVQKNLPTEGGNTFARSA